MKKKIFLYLNLMLLGTGLGIHSSFAADVLANQLLAGQWHGQVSPSCQLTYEVPDHGKGVFSHNKQQGLSFYWDAREKIKVPAKSIVDIQATPPDWRHDIAPEYLGFAHAPAAQHLFELPAPQASQVLLALDKGVNIQFKLQVVPALMVDDEEHSSSSSAKSLLAFEINAHDFVQAARIFNQCAGIGLVNAGETSEQKKSDVARIKSYVASSRSDIQSASSKAFIEKPVIEKPAIEKPKPWKFVADPKKSDWELSAGPFACGLVQEIPAFGKAVFEHKAGAQEIFYLSVTEKNNFMEGEAKLETLPPAWKASQTPALIGKTQSHKTNPAISLEAEPLMLLSVQLTTGMPVMISGPMDQDVTTYNNNIMRVILDSKHFKEKYKEFEKCSNQLVQITFAQVARTQFNYPEKFSGLSDSDKTTLAKIARYVNADVNVLSILVDAHSDNSGSAEENADLSKKVADAVAHYLKDKGVSETKLTSRAHADKFPIADNRTPEGRAQNRRFTVRVIDEQARIAAEKAVAERKAAEEQKAAMQQSSLPNQIAKKLDEIHQAENSSAAQTSDAVNASSSSSNKKVTAEEIRKLIEGLNAIDGQ